MKSRLDVCVPRLDPAPLMAVDRCSTIGIEGLAAARLTDIAWATYVSAWDSILQSSFLCITCGQARVVSASHCRLADTGKAEPFFLSSGI